MSFHQTYSCITASRSEKNTNDARRIFWASGLEEVEEHSRKNYLDGLLKFKQILVIMFILVINQERDLCLFTFSHLFTSSFAPSLTSALLRLVFNVIGGRKPLGCLDEHRFVQIPEHLYTVC